MTMMAAARAEEERMCSPPSTCGAVDLYIIFNVQSTVIIDPCGPGVTAVSVGLKTLLQYQETCGGDEIHRSRLGVASIIMGDSVALAAGVESQEPAEDDGFSASSRPQAASTGSLELLSEAMNSLVASGSIKASSPPNIWLW